MFGGNFQTWKLHSAQDYFMFFAYIFAGVLVFWLIAKHMNKQRNHEKAVEKVSARLKKICGKPGEVLKNATLNDTNRKSRTNTRSDRKTDKIPDDEEDHPDHFKNNSDRKKVGNKSTDLYILHVLCLCGCENHPDIRGHRCNCVCRGIPKSVKQLCEARMVTKEHEHRNEDRREDRPFCGTG